MGATKRRVNFYFHVSRHGADSFDSRSRTFVMLNPPTLREASSPYSCLPQTLRVATTQAPQPPLLNPAALNLDPLPIVLRQHALMRNVRPFAGKFGVLVNPKT